MNVGTYGRSDFVWGFFCLDFFINFARLLITNLTQTKLMQAILKTATTLALIFFCASVYAQTLQVSDISISGNRKTKPNIILCEMEVQAGDTLSAGQLPQILEKSKDNLLKTSLFNYVTITPEYNAIDSSQLMINIAVEERWYLWPNANITPHNGNLNDWLSDPDLSLIDYCVGIKKYNFRGRREAVYINTRFGFNNFVQIGYQNIGLDKKRNHMLSLAISTKRQKSLTIKEADNKSHYQEFDGVKTAIRDYNYEVTYTYRPETNLINNLTLGYIKTKIHDSVAIENPDFLGNGRKRLEGITLKYEFRLDNRNSNYYPLKGSFTSIYLHKKGLFGNNLDLWKADIDFRKYFQVADRLYLASQIYGSFSSNGMPFCMMEAIGYKPNILKGYEQNYIAGRNLMYLNTSYKWEIVKPHIWHIKRLNLPRFNKIHYAVYINLFANAGYVSSKNLDTENLNTMNGTLLGAVGAGLDFVTYYDRVFTIYAAHNAQGKTYVGIGFKTAF